MEFKNLKREKFYKTLLHLRKRNIALSANASFKKVDLGDKNMIYAYTREKDNKKILVILNFSDKEQSIKISDKSLLGKTHNVFSEKVETLSGSERKIKPWGYEVYEY